MNAHKTKNLEKKSSAFAKGVTQHSQKPPPPPRPFCKAAAGARWGLGSDLGAHLCQDQEQISSKGIGERAYLSHPVHSAGASHHGRQEQKSLPGIRSGRVPVVG